MKTRPNSLSQRMIDFLKENPENWYSPKHIAFAIRKKFSKDYNNKPVSGTASTPEEIEEKLIRQLSAEISSRMIRYFQTTPEEERQVEKTYIGKRVKFKYKKSDNQVESFPILQFDSEQNEESTYLKEDIDILFASIVEATKNIGKSSILIQKQMNNANIIIEIEMN